MAGQKRPKKRAEKKVEAEKSSLPLIVLTLVVSGLVGLKGGFFYTYHLGNSLDFYKRLPNDTGSCDFPECQQSFS